MAASTFVRSGATGAVATLADLTVVGLGVAFGIPARAVNLPALLLGATLQFVGNRHVAFRAQDGSLQRQLTGFVLTEVVALALNAVLFDVAARQIELFATSAVALRAAIGFVVFVTWSYPMWRKIF